MILSYDAYTQTIEKQQQEISELDDIRKDIDYIKSVMRSKQQRADKE
jgi:hypothetical protein